jgi:hypothetical protein
MSVHRILPSKISKTFLQAPIFSFPTNVFWMAKSAQPGRMPLRLYAPPAKRKASAAVVVHDDPYSIKGFELSMYDIRCYICLGWDQKDMSRLVCLAPGQRCECRVYLCTAHVEDPHFESRCTICKQPGGVVPDPTATALLRGTALLKCESPSCPELVTLDNMETHLLSECSFNKVSCTQPGCPVR